MPGLLSMMGETQEAVMSLNAMLNVKEEHGFLPERFDYGRWEVEGGDKSGGGAGKHPLRPELFESLYFVQRANRGMGGGGWLNVAENYVDLVEKKCRTKCGYASIDDVVTMKLSDNMPSYFLSEVRLDKERSDSKRVLIAFLHN